MKAIETEYIHLFGEDEDGQLEVSEGADLATALDILNNPQYYLPTATQEQRLQRHQPGQRPAAAAANLAQSVMPQMGCMATGQPPMQQSYGGQPHPGVPWNPNQAYHMPATASPNGPSGNQG